MAKASQIPALHSESFKLPRVMRWRPKKAGDVIAGIVVSSGVKSWPTLDSSGERSVPVAIVHATTLYGGVIGESGYYELVGLAAVLERLLHELRNAPAGTRFRLCYDGTAPASTKGHNDVQLFDLSLGTIAKPIPKAILSDAPALPQHISGALGTGTPDEGEPF